MPDERHRAAVVGPLILESIVRRQGLPCETSAPSTIGRNEPELASSLVHDGALAAAPNTVAADASFASFGSTVVSVDASTSPRLRGRFDRTAARTRPRLEFGIGEPDALHFRRSRYL
jgi:hypothetical protein